MIQRVSDQHKIKAMDALSELHKPLNERAPEMKKRAEKQSDRSWEKISPSSKMASGVDENGVIIGKGSSVHSAQTGSILDIGGPNKHIGLESSNTIFSPDKVEQTIKSQSSREVTAQEKESIAKARAEKEAAWRMNNSPKAGEPVVGDNRAFGQEGSKGWVPSHKMSMFDTKEFERLSAPPGESFKKEKVANKDDSWRKPTKAMNTGDMTEKMIDRLTSNADPSVKNNMRESAVDRLFNILKKDE